MKGQLKLKLPLLAICLLISTLSQAAGYPAPPTDPSLPPSTVEPTVQQLRRAMLDQGVSSLAMHNMDELFTTRIVGRSGPAWNLQRDDRTLDFTYEFQGQMYTPDEFLERTYTNALLIMKNGKIIFEKYRNQTNETTRFMAFSMTKSITSILIGIALEEKRIDSIDDPIDKYLPELSKSGYEGVTIRQILQMRSGINYPERYDFGNPGIAATNHENSLVLNVTRFADIARTLKRKHPPGKVWEYKTIDTAVLGWLLERVSGGSTVAAYTSQRLWEPLGAEANGYYIMDGPPDIGREFSGAGFNATLRDFARLGQMVLNGGVANGHRIVSERWLKESTAPTDKADPVYGYQWWMGLRPGSFEASGLLGQYIFIDPTTNTVAVKLSYYPPGDMVPHQETQHFLAAVSAWSPE